MIRQAISCDICGAEMQRANHWFVAYGQGEELRVSGWHTGKRLRAGAKHLCGQTCLHKLVDEFLARTAVMPQRKSPEPPPLSASVGEFESSARLIPAPEPAQAAEDPHAPQAPTYTVRNWRAEAWKRERERTLRSDTRATLLTTHRRNIA